MTRKTKIVVFSTIPTVLIAGGIALWFLVFNAPNASAAVDGTTVEIVEVERLVQQEGIEISGNIEPANSADLAFPIAGYIAAIYVDEGDYIEAGTTVAKLEDSQQRYNLASVEMEIDTENVTGTRRNLDLLELKLEMTADELEDTRLSSTLTGLVTSVAAEEGDYVTALTAGASADVVVRVIDRSSMTATVEVDELDAPYLKLGQKVEFQFDAYPDLLLEGRVSSIPLEASKTTQGIAVLDAEVAIDNPPDEILPYFTFAGEIFLDDQEDLLLIPEDAVMTMGTRTMVMKVMTVEEAEAAMAERMGSRGDAADGGAPSGDTGGRPSGGMPGDFGADLNLPEGMTVMPAQVTVKDYGSGKVQVVSGLEAGDTIAVITTADGQAVSGDSDEEGGTDVMSLLGMPSRPGGGGGPRP